jgi:hypothetical protein
MMQMRAIYKNQNITQPQLQPPKKEKKVAKLSHAKFDIMAYSGELH